MVPKLNNIAPSSLMILSSNLCSNTIYKTETDKLRKILRNLKRNSTTRFQIGRMSDDNKTIIKKERKYSRRTVFGAKSDKCSGAVRK